MRKETDYRMLRYIHKLYPLVICCTIALLFPIDSATAGKYWSIPSKLRGTIDSPLEASFELYVKNRRSPPDPVNNRSDEFRRLRHFKK